LYPKTHSKVLHLCRPREVLHELRSAPRTVLASGRPPILTIRPACLDVVDRACVGRTTTRRSSTPRSQWE
jgi:hypothetical protein